MPSYRGQSDRLLRQSLRGVLNHLRCSQSFRLLPVVKQDNVGVTSLFVTTRTRGTFATLLALHLIPLWFQKRVSPSFQRMW